ncbi:hypothetical protein [Streptomyces sp. enrichment culture]|uniref:hypothetical protein n=1 Tax=Streptomyces sp. enrichment culture TaxID=1795815 RepID=UPI003F55F2BA
MVTLEKEDDVEDILGEMLTRLREAGVEAESTVAGALTTHIAATVSSAAEEWRIHLRRVLGGHRDGGGHDRGRVHSGSRAPQSARRQSDHPP